MTSSASKPSTEEISFATSFSDPILDRCFGLCIGAGIGDSIGSYCEFKRYEIPDDVLDIAMEMPGGGTWGNRVCGGQITDDTEIAISLAYGLIAIVGKTSIMQRMHAYENAQNHNQNILAKNKFIDENKIQSKENNINNNKDDIHIFDLGEIAKEYKRWLRSSPFDVGFCTRQTFGCAPNVNKMRKRAFEYNSTAATKYKSDGNLANGSLMRCMPLIVYGYRLSNQSLYNLMTADAKLSHANDITFIVNTAYAIMVKYLIQYSDDKNRNRTAFWKALEWMRKEAQKQNSNNNSPKKKSKPEYEQSLATDSCPSSKAAREVLSWVEWIFICGKANKYKVPKKDLIENMVTSVKQLGFVKIAFQRACYHLYSAHTFEFSIRDTVREAGDSDTNACIVGGLMGAFHGLSAIPKRMKRKIIHCNPDGIVRDLFQTKWYFKDNIIQHLIAEGPKNDSQLVFREQYP